MESKIVEDGKFRVYESGFIEKLNRHGFYVAANMTHAKVGRGKSQPELILSYTENNEQRRYYAKRLIADAFVPKLNNEEFIDYLDGDYTNLRADNIYRKTQIERVKKAVESRNKNAVNCKNCDKKTINYTRVCKQCKAKEKEIARLKSIEVTKVKRIAKEMENFKNVDFDILSNIERAYVERKMKGYTLDEIGKEFGKSRERIRQVLVKVKNKNL